MTIYDYSLLQFYYVLNLRRFVCPRGSVGNFSTSFEDYEVIPGISQLTCF